MQEKIATDTTERPMLTIMETAFDRCNMRVPPLLSMRTADRYFLCSSGPEKI